MTETVPSPELLAVARRFLRALRDGDAAAVRSLLSASEHLRWIGTAAEELFSGDVVRTGLADHFAEIPNYQDEELMAEAFECGSAGWALFVRRLRWESGGDPMVFRYTLCFALEDGVWRVTQRHASAPKANLEVYGGEHHALHRLAKAAEQGGHLAGRSGLTAVMFTDVVGSTGMAAEMSDEAWTARIREHFARVRGAVDACGGELVKSLGDGTLSVFGSAREAVAAALRIRSAEAAVADPPLILRIGIDVGDVVAVDDDFFGTVVNRAARIAASAAPGAIRVSDAVHALAGAVRNARFGARTSVVLRGVEGEQTVREVLPDL